MGITGYAIAILMHHPKEKSHTDTQNNRLYSELGPGERISLAKVASDHFEATGRRLRLAVDASIWSFQVQSGKGTFVFGMQCISPKKRKN
jgi:hypothetical protein